MHRNPQLRRSAGTRIAAALLWPARDAHPWATVDPLQYTWGGPAAGHRRVLEPFTLTGIVPEFADARKETIESDVAFLPHPASGHIQLLSSALLYLRDCGAFFRNSSGGESVFQKRRTWLRHTVGADSAAEIAE